MLRSRHFSLGLLAALVSACTGQTGATGPGDGGRNSDGGSSSGVNGDAGKSGNADGGRFPHGGSEAGVGIPGGDGSVPPGNDAGPSMFDANIPPLGSMKMSCGAATPGAAPSSTDAIDADTLGTPGGDSARQYPLGSPILITFTTQPGAADTVKWSVADAWQKVQASGQFDVGASAATTTVQCTSTLAGYFALAASLVTNGATLPSVGTRPAGIATFGVLPDLSTVLPAVTFPHLDDHRFGIQGAAYINPPNGYDPFINNLGATWITTGLQWSTTEPNGPGTYDPATYSDDPTDGDAALIADGALPYLDMSGIPGWANSSGSSSAQYPPTSFSDYQNYMSEVGMARAAAISQYGTLAHNYYQITWEPDPGTGNAWEGTNADFVSMYRAAYTGLHSTDPDALVLGLTASSVSSDASMMTTMLAAGLGQYVDGFTYHGYYDAPDCWSNPPEETSWGTELPQQVRNLRHVLATAMKPHAKLIQSEMGIRYPVDGAYGPSYPPLPQLAEQGAVVARAHLIQLGEGTDIDFFFYPADFPGDTGSGLNFDLIYDANNNATIYGEGAISPKPGFMMAAALTRLVDGTVTLGYLNNLPTGVYGYAFQRLGNGPVVTAMWTHNTAWTATATQTLAVAASGTNATIAQVDSMGNPSPITVTNGQVTLNLTEYPVYVISGDAATIESQVTVPEGYDPVL